MGNCCSCWKAHTQKPKRAMGDGFERTIADPQKPIVPEPEANLVRCVSRLYLTDGNLYVKSDVYGFGVVLAEILTGLRAIDKRRQTEKRILANWVKPYLSNRNQLKEIMDSRLEGKYSPKAAATMALLASRCLHQIPELRPSMQEVVDSLEQVQDRYMKSPFLLRSLSNKL